MCCGNRAAINNNKSPAWSPVAPSRSDSPASLQKHLTTSRLFCFSFFMAHWPQVPTGATLRPQAADYCRATTASPASQPAGRPAPQPEPSSRRNIKKILAWRCRSENCISIMLYKPPWSKCIFISCSPRKIKAAGCLGCLWKPDHLN